ncbi:hypothetical protein ABK040_007172 [Willaertia magna]
MSTLDGFISDNIIYSLLQSDDGDNKNINVKIDYVSIIIIIGAVFALIFIILLLSMIIFRNSKRKYKLFQFRKREKSNLDFDKEFYKTKITNKKISLSIMKNANQSKEIQINLQSPINNYIPLMKQIPTFPHLYTFTAPHLQGLVFYWNEKLNEENTIYSPNHNNMNNEIRNSIHYQRDHLLPVDLINDTIHSPSRLSIGSEKSTSTTVVINNNNIIGNSPLTSLSTTMQQQICKQQPITLQDFQRMIKYNYITYFDFIRISPYILEKYFIQLDNDLIRPFTLNVRKYLEDVILKKFNLHENNEDLKLNIEKYLNIYEENAFQTANKISTTTEEFIEFLNILNFILTIS